MTENPTTPGKTDTYFGSHELQAREMRVKSSSDRGFGLVFAAVFALIGLAGAYHNTPYFPWWLGASAALALVALTAPRILAPFNRAWTKLGMVLALVVNPIVLGLVFYLCVTPIGLLLRLFGKDLLALRWQPAQASYWIVRDPPGPRPETLRHQF